MKILAIDTSSDNCSVAILEDNNVIKQLKLKDEKTHSQKLMPLIDKLLSECNYKINDFDLFACSKGPGSFTGIRIGIATIKAFSDATSKPLIGISSLKSLAYNLIDYTSNSYVVSLIDAKHGNVYCGVFKKEGKKYIKVNDYTFDSINAVLENLKIYKSKLIFIGNGGIIYKDMIKFALGDTCKFVENETLNDCNASSIGYAAYLKFIDGNILPIIPLYLKKSSAELLLEDKKNECRYIKNDM